MQTSRTASPPQETQPTNRNGVGLTQDTNHATGPIAAVERSTAYALLPVERTAVRVLQLPLLPEDDPSPGSGYDRVPELTHYQDEGCRVWHACLTCPLARCIFDDPVGVRSATNRAVNSQRDSEIRRRYHAGEQATALAREFRIGRRTVYRIVERG